MTDRSMCDDKLRCTHFCLLLDWSLSVAFATISLAHFNVPRYVKSFANLVMTLFIRYCRESVAVAPGKSKRANKLSSAPSFLPRKKKEFEQKSKNQYNFVLRLAFGKTTRAINFVFTWPLANEQLAAIDQDHRPRSFSLPKIMAVARYIATLGLIRPPSIRQTFAASTTDGRNPSR